MANQHGFTVLSYEQKSLILDKVKNMKGIAYYREGSFSDEVIWQGRKFLFPSKKKKRSVNSMWIFRAVMSDVRLYLEDKQKLRSKDRLPVNRWNPNLENFKGKITATDVNHAYWRIAYLLGVITKKTYEKGLQIKDKSLRLAALANLASAKEYRVIKDGQFTDKIVILRHDPVLQRVYNNIRYICFEHMTAISLLLGDDFICYKTDCIYYKDTPENRKLVQTYLDVTNLQWKQLVEPERPKKEEEEYVPKKRKVTGTNRITNQKLRTKN